MEKDTYKSSSRDSLPEAPMFKPLTEGLGLNHFAEGLPYTPSAAKRRAAVPFNFPPPRAPRQNLASAPPELYISAPAPSVATPLVESEHASFVRRIGAFVLDVVLASSIFMFVVWAGFAINGYDLAALLLAKDASQLVAPLVLLYIVVHMGYFLIQETTWRRTLGKSFFGIRIHSTSGLATIGRAVCFFVSAIPFGLGLFWYFFDSKHRCWHDVISDCEVRTG